MIAKFCRVFFLAMCLPAVAASSPPLSIVSFSEPSVDIIQAVPGPGTRILSTYPSFTEYQRSGHKARVAVGALGSLEANMSYNMDYSSGTHRLYDTSQAAYWTALNYNGYYLQYAPAGTAAGDVWDNSGNKYGFYFSIDAARFGGDITPFEPGKGRLGAPKLGFKQLYMDGQEATVTGSVTINKAVGRVYAAPGESVLFVTNALVTAASRVFAVITTNDSTAVLKNVVPVAGGFQINLYPPTGQTSLDFFVVN